MAEEQQSDCIFCIPHQHTTYGGLNNGRIGCWQICFGQPALDKLVCGLQEGEIVPCRTHSGITETTHDRD